MPGPRSNDAGSALPPAGRTDMNKPAGGPKVVVVGGGATGCGVARDLVLRGFDVTLVEYGDLGCGTSSRFHGMLQSGARYAVSDTVYAGECMRERRIVQRLAPEAVEETGGLFVSLPGDPDDYGDKFLAGCRKAGIPVEELDPKAVMAEEPNVSRHIKRAFAVPDATVQPWRLLNLLAQDMRRRGVAILLRHRVTGFDLVGGRVRAVKVESPTGTLRLETDAVVNAAGPWSGQIALMLGQDVALELIKGSILVFGHRLVSRAINRCRVPSSHDIMVPTGTVSLFGTTSEVVEDPGTTFVRPEEVQALLDGAEPMVPGIRGYRALRAWAGVRPIVKPADWPQGKSLPRRHKVIDHGDAGLAGAFTVCGGSWTTHRSMGEDVGDSVAAYFGVNRPSETAATPVSSPDEAGAWKPVAGYEAVEREGDQARTLCECESITRDMVADLVDGAGLKRFHDLRRRLRIGFGPCQGTFCGSRLAGLVAGADPEFPARRELEAFWAERLKGAAMTAWGHHARQVLLSDAVFRENLGIDLDTTAHPGGDDR